MRRISMILIILLGGGAIAYSVILGTPPTVYFPGERIAPMAQSPGDEGNEDGTSDNPLGHPESRDVSDGPRPAF